MSKPPPRRRIVEPPPPSDEPTPEDERPPTTPFPLVGEMSDAVVVPHTLEMLGDVEQVLAHELRLLRQERLQSGDVMDGRQVHKFEKLTNVLAKMAELKRVSKGEEAESLRSLSEEDLKKLLTGKKA